ncbi:hypothetical protein OGATHE_001729 [Ogataea polymorpha]|uniref:Uncharacterized protein n=1 Tax=Ogataea polymorpha TaxID=460523 RepID=A0A9P8PQB2_9ASCO|nr:hypothetical protein OGATHE_001729 [Ogataea polymorpha]
MNMIDPSQEYCCPTRLLSVLNPKIAAVLRDTLSTAPMVAVKKSVGSRIKSVFLMAHFSSAGVSSSNLPLCSARNRRALSALGSSTIDF